MNCSAFLPHINSSDRYKLKDKYYFLPSKVNNSHCSYRGQGQARQPNYIGNPHWTWWTLPSFSGFDSDMKVWQCWTHSMTVLTLVVLLLVCLTGFYWCLPLHCTSLLWFTHTTSMHLQICIMCNNVVFIFSQLTQKAILLEWERLEWQRLSSHKVITPLLIF